MARMTAARAAVEILKREGVSDAFGVPGAAINPFYAALKASGGISHTLARHVEGASWHTERRAKEGKRFRFQLQRPQSTFPTQLTCRA
ncbi:thiamine pyrophosphate-binding protein, partial [Streptomyces sp. NPDC005568]|uniref:thiamine pyrophosphate-binding protein n=1 Tax=Streptomyces sp. NPDC005568 TaxID=3156887 RepID=UPI0033BD97F5